MTFVCYNTLAQLHMTSQRAKPVGMADTSNEFRACQEVLAAASKSAKVLLDKYYAQAAQMISQSTSCIAPCHSQQLLERQI